MFALLPDCPAIYSQRGPTMVGGVECRPCQQPLRCEKPFSCLDICTVCKGPMGALPLHISQTRKPTKTLSYSPQLCVAICFHKTATANAIGRPQVSRTHCYVSYYPYPSRKGSGCIYNLIKIKFVCLSQETCVISKARILHICNLLSDSKKVLYNYNYLQ